MTDREIIQAIRTSPDAGFRALLKAYKEPLYWHIRRMVGVHDDAADVLQETFMKVYHGFGSFRKEESLRPWLYRIATNESVRHLASMKKAAVSIDDPESGASAIAADSEVDYSDLEAVKLQNVVLRLPPKQRTVFSLRYYEEMDYAEIAKVANVSIASAKMNYHLAKNKIIKQIFND